VVEQWPEEPRVDSSILSLGTIILLSESSPNLMRYRIPGFQVRTYKYSFLIYNPHELFILIHDIIHRKQYEIPPQIVLEVSIYYVFFR
jgi:hypothetical protein